MLSNPTDIKALKDCIIEISNSMTRIDAERDFQKEALSELEEKIDIKKANIKRLAVVYHRQNISEVLGKAEELDQLYEQVFAINNKED